MNLKNILNKLKNNFNIFIYISLGFLIFYLIKLDYLQFEGIRFNVVLLIISILILFIAFLVSSYSWKVALQKHGISIDNVYAITSQGQSIFSKYIPGKIWVIMGRAGFVKLLGYDMKVTTFASLKAQIIELWTGLMLGIIPFAVLKGFDIVVIISVVFLLGITLFIFNKRIHELIIKLIGKIIKKEFNLPFVDIRNSIPIILSYFLFWISLSIGFLLLSKAVYADTSWVNLFAYPLGVTLGILAIIFPGGIGIREGILTSFLTMTGIPLEIATTISVIQRLWFLTGEVFIFVLATILRRKHPLPQIEEADTPAREDAQSSNESE